MTKPGFFFATIIDSFNPLYRGVLIVTDPGTFRLPQAECFNPLYRGVLIVTQERRPVSIPLEQLFQSSL